MESAPSPMPGELSSEVMNGDGMDAIPRNSNGLDYYLDIVRRHSLDPMTRKEETEVFNALYSGDGDQAEKARDRIVRSNLRFVINVSKYYRDCGIEMVDLIGAGNMGLMRAIDRFDAKKGYKFITYAVWWIKQEILKLLDAGRALKFPVNVHCDRRKIIKTIRATGSTLDYAGYRDAGEALGMSEVRTLNATMSSMSIISLDCPLEDREDGTHSSGRHESVPDDKASVLEALTGSGRTNDIMRILDEKLAPRSKAVVVMYYGLNGDPEMTLEEIGEIFQLTRERIRQIRNVAINKIRKSSVLQDWARVS